MQEEFQISDEFPGIRDFAVVDFLSERGGVLLHLRRWWG